MSYKLFAEQWCVGVFVKSFLVTNQSTYAVYTINGKQKLVSTYCKQTE